MALTRWDPFTDMARLRTAMDRFFDEPFRRHFWGNGGDGANILPLDVYETPSELVLKAHVPGSEANDVHISFERGTLTIQAHLASDAEKEEAKNWRWHYREMWYGDVTRTFSVPSMFDAEKAEASFKNGVLTLRMPKTEAAKPREIPISVN